VQVNTLDFPSNFMLQAGVEAASDNVSNNKDIRVAPGGGSDWKAKDDGTRAFPTGKTGVDIAKAMPNNWGTSGGNSNLNSNYGFAIGDKFDVGGGQIGFIGSATYKNSYKIEEYHQEPQGNGQDIFEFDGKRYKEKYLWGGLANLSWHINENNKINFENNYTRSAEDKVTQAKGLAESRDSTRTQTISWAQRDIYLGQLKGQHTLSFAHGLDLNWRLTSTTSSAQEPDRKFAAYAKRAVANAPYLMNENYRTWSDLTEDTHGGALDAEYPVGGGSFKAGYAQNHRERDFSIDAYATDASKLDRKYRSLVLLPIDKIFDPDNYGKDANGKQMFGFIPFTAFTGEYNGTQDLHAYYGMYDSPFKLMHRGFRFAGGLRVEDSDQSVNTPKSIDDPTIIVSHQQNTDALPSANLTCEVTKTSNIRLGYYKSVNRPEFRELANVAYLDFDRNQTVIGNSNLERAVIRNYDVRMEWFPRPGEVLAASWFYKDLTNAIEEELLPSPDRYVRTWFNSPNGKNVGYEIEARKSLGFVTQSLQNLTVQGNFTHVSSDVEYKDSYTDQAGNPHTSTKTRPLQGQAPYTVNAGLTYSFPELGLSTSLLYNRFGRRLDSVGDSRDEDVYEESRDLLDFALTEQFTPWMRLKFTVKDMLAQDKVLTFGNSGSVWESVNTGTTYALSLAFSL
jgi:TonB-dependent receptor